jgi:aspartyl-tRNA(Asn)/glutamyl-tRNA(Gln) amidotransferase subunit C
MKISAKDVRHIAKLAELDVPEADIAKLVSQLDRIVEYVGQLAELGMDASAPAFLPGPEATPLRTDEVRPTPLARTPAEMAPAFREGLFVVPRLSALEEP